MADLIYFVVPCYNEEEVLGITADRLMQKLGDCIRKGLAAEKSRILFVDDGSRDKTWQIIAALSEAHPACTGIKLSKNKGHQNALFAGLMAAKQYADAVISMDADLQDDIGVIESFLQAYYDGCDIVYGVRKSRGRDSFFKRTTARGFYRLMRAMGVDLVADHADYRLMSRKALECLGQFKEVNLFLRGIVPLIGLKSTAVAYERGERAAGVSKYPLKKMLSFALDGITSFSVKPIRLITLLGGFVSLASAAVLIALVIVKLFGYTVVGWTSILCSIWFLGGVQLLSLGIIGEYIGKIYYETKERPRYFIEEDLRSPDRRN